MLATLSPATLALAQATSTPGAANRAEIRENRREMFVTRATAFGDRAVIRLNLAVQRLRNHISRVETRLETFRENGNFDVEAVESSLTAAKADLAKAETQIADLPEAIEAALGNEDKSAAFQAIKTLVKAAVQSIQDAGQKVVQAIIIIRGGNTNL